MFAPHLRLQEEQERSHTVSWASDIADIPTAWNKKPTQSVYISAMPEYTYTGKVLMICIACLCWRVNAAMNTRVSRIWSSPFRYGIFMYVKERFSTFQCWKGFFSPVLEVLNHRQCSITMLVLLYIISVFAKTRRPVSHRRCLALLSDVESQYCTPSIGHNGPHINLSAYQKSGESTNYK